jgi:hypothetical protein
LGELEELAQLADLENMDDLDENLVQHLRMLKEAQKHQAAKKKGEDPSQSHKRSKTQPPGIDSTRKPKLATANELDIQD